ncbi:MAG: nitrous oxide reductase family maturation protein NosD, partial [Candidatus Hermodarchaeota archaeon]
MRKKYLLFLGSITIFALIVPVLSLSLSCLGANETSSNFRTSQLTEQKVIVMINDLPASLSNWTWAKDQGYCTGSGTMGDPYTVSDFFFNTPSHNFNCLTIINSRKYFIIEDCLFKGNSEYAGIGLHNTTNGLIRSNKLYPFTGGLVWIHNSSLNEISRNNASAGYYYGIFIDGNCSSNIISTNLVSFNMETGIQVSGNSTINNITDNTVYNNTEGIGIDDSSDYNIIHGNIIRDNTEFGIGITSENNTIYQNCFINNGLHAFDDGVNNVWDFLGQGNYWDNYTGIDSDQNGIGDVPYNITGPARSQDNFPLMSCPLFISDEAIPGYNLLIMYLTGITM